MRSSKNRSRSKGNRNRSPMGNIVNRVFDSSGPEGKVRGTPQQIIDKYNQLTRDAQLSNDRVAAENFQQHAEHYTRMLGEAQREQDAKRAEQEAQQAQAQARRQQRDDDNGQDSGNQGGGNDDRPEANTSRQGGDQQGGGQDQDKSFDSVIDTGSDSPSGLVDTPENAPKPKRARTRKPAKKTSDEGTSDSGNDGGDASNQGGPQAAE